MRNEDQPPAQTSGDVAEVPCDERVYFESFYKANVRGRPEDRMTIGIVAEPEARFHYNALENSLLRAFARVCRSRSMIHACTCCCVPGWRSAVSYTKS